MDDTLLERIDETLDEIRELRAQLVADPTLATNDHWREHLETAAYHATSNLAADE